MISAIQFPESFGTSKYSFVQGLPFFNNLAQLDFKPGINVVVGPNGSGKSTLLQMLADYLCATQGGVSVVTQDSVWQTVDMLGSIDRATRKKEGAGQDKLGYRVLHDGKGIGYCVPRNNVGIVGGQLDDDFLEAGVINAQSKQSTGLTTLRKLSPWLNAMDKSTPSFEIERRMKPDHVNDVWQAALALVEKRLSPLIPVGATTVIFDEPESGLSLPVQARLFKKLVELQKKSGYQIIMASHSPFCFGIKDAHYIETVDEFASEAESALKLAFAQ